MIVKIAGKLVEKKSQSVIINVHGLFYEVLVSVSVLNRIEETLDSNGDVHLIVYHYFQIGPGSGAPIMIGFINEVEKDFFQQFITVSGIGPRAAVKALNKPISEITRAIDAADMTYLKTLPGIGLQRAKEIIAKLQGKVGKFGLIQDRERHEVKQPVTTTDWQQEALEVLIQLQYKRHEALDMVEKAVERSKSIHTAEELLNEIYKQRAKN